MIWLLVIRVLIHIFFKSRLHTNSAVFSHQLINPCIVWKNEKKNVLQIDVFVLFQLFVREKCCNIIHNSKLFILEIKDGMEGKEDSVQLNNS